MPHLQTSILPFIPKTDNAVVRRAAGDHVISIAFNAVQGTVMWFFPFLDTLPVVGGGGEVSQERTLDYCLLETTSHSLEHF